MKSLKNFVLVCLVCLACFIFGITFLYNGLTGEGVVYYNAGNNHSVVILDPSTNQATFYKCEVISTLSLQDTIKLYSLFKSIKIKSWIKPEKSENSGNSGDLRTY